MWPTVGLVNDFRAAFLSWEILLPFLVSFKPACSVACTFSWQFQWKKMQYDVVMWIHIVDLELSLNSDSPVPVRESYLEVSL